MATLRLIWLKSVVVTGGKRLENLHGPIKVITQGNEDRHVTASN
jgi:hypothetical protein